MKLAIALVVALGSARMAGAQTAAETPRLFPEAVVDRPLVLYPGMTTFEMSIYLPTITVLIVDAAGNRRLGPSPLGH